MNQQMMTVLWIAALGAMMYFLMIRPQQKQQKAKKQMMNELKKGDRVVTIGGIYGIVRAVKDDRVTLEVASEVFVQFSKSAVGNVLRNDGKGAATSDTKPLPAGDDAEDADYVIEQDADTDQDQDQGQE